MEAIREETAEIPQDVLAKKMDNFQEVCRSSKPSFGQYNYKNHV